MIMAMEGRVRKPNRRSWPGFLNRMIPASVWQAWARQFPPASDGRIAWTPKYILLTLVFMGWAAPRSLTQRFHEARESLIAWFYDRARPGRTFPGLVDAACRTGTTRLRSFWHCLRQHVPARVGATWTWFGWEIFATDGSREDTARTQANEAELERCGEITRRPRLFAVQAANCAAFAAAWATGGEEYVPIRPTPTVADGIATVQPVRTAEVLRALRRSRGEVVAVPEDEIGPAVAALGRLGLYVEPTAATAAAALSRLIATGTVRADEVTVVVLTGHGLKAADRIGDLLGI